MGRPPCCDKIVVKKGPWTPEEDALLISYVDENGPGNWRAVPTKTGLRRCSKSCRLRWTNYLRPGIKRGTFTDHEQKMIVQLQALLGNKWAAIASYLPERTDNDIKNYWNTHLKKKLQRLEIGPGPRSRVKPWESGLALPIDDNAPLQGASGYASSTENIAKLLKGWVKSTPESLNSPGFGGELFADDDEGKNGIHTDLSQAFEALFGFGNGSSNNNNHNNYCGEFSRSDSPSGEMGPDPTGQLAPLSVLEDWLLDDHKDCLGSFSFDENPKLF